MTLTKQTFEFKALNDYREKGIARAEKLAESQVKVEQANAEVARLTAEYEQLFVEGVKTGVDKTAELDNLEDDLEKARRYADRVARERNVAHQVLPQVDVDTVALVEQFRTEFTPQVKASVIPDVEERLKTARDMLISAMQDMQQADVDYQEVTEEVSKISRDNKERGLTRDHIYVSHPTKDATLLNQRGITNAVQKVFEDYNAALRGSLPYDFKYIKSAEVAK